VGKVREIDNWEDTGIDGSIILKCGGVDQIDLAQDTDR
jgi:hypothetical protein